MQRLYIVHSIPINNDDAVHMIWHYHKCIQMGKRKMLGHLVPAVVSNLTYGCQMHFAMLNFTEKMLTTLGADGNEIGSITAVIPPRCTGRRHTVFISEQIGHGVNIRFVGMWLILAPCLHHPFFLRAASISCSSSCCSGRLRSMVRSSWVAVVRCCCARVASVGR